jgi:hypothetical protein
MHALGTFLMHLLTVLFFVGMAGSAVVIILAFVEDFRELFGPDDESSTEAPKTTQQAARR